MTPQEKNVFGKLFTKTELGKHEIELGLLDDIKSDFNFVDKDFGNVYDGFYNDIESAKNKQSLIKNDLPLPPGPVINKFSPFKYLSKQICCSRLNVDIINFYNSLKKL